MSAVFFRELRMPRPKHQLDIHGQTHGQMTGRMLAAIEEILLERRPKAVLVYGDTNSTLAGGLAAAKLAIPLIHVEAGLRSYNRQMPEEINRVLVDHVSDLLLCPTTRSVANLAAEGIIRNVHHVGDVMYDATLQVTPLATKTSDVMERLGLKSGAFAVATIHRAENTDSADALNEIVEFLREQARGRTVVLPLHPRTRAAADRHAIALDGPGFKLTDPLGYLDMVCLLHHAEMVFTDSGGLQKEAYFHRKPCVTLRSETEWVETIEHGWNRLWRGPAYKPRSEISDYGRGDAAVRMAEVIRALL